METKLILNELIKKRMVCSTLAEHRDPSHILWAINDYL